MDKRKKKREDKQKLKKIIEPLKNANVFLGMTDRKTDKTMYRLDMHMS